jgi:hypothetical protein
LDVGLRSSTQPTHNQRFCFLSDDSNRRALMRFWILDFGFWIGQIQFWILDFGFWIGQIQLQ